MHGREKGAKMTANFLFMSATVLLALAVAVVSVVALRVYLRYRGKMLVRCPETGKTAAVKVAAGDAARSALLEHGEIHLKECSRWPERQSCGQDCLSQVGADPQSCLVRTKVADWYRGRTCAYCHKPFGELHWHDHRPAVIGPNMKTVQWSEVAPQDLPEIFETYLPVCWSCHIAETFRREHPELVVDRPGNRGPMGELLTEHKEEHHASPTSRN